MGKIRMTFKREQLLYDIENYAYIEGDKIPEGTEHVKHLTTDIAEEGNVDRVNRILGVVHAAAIEMLFPYTKVETGGFREISDELTVPEKYVIDLDVPEGMSETTVRLLHKLIHEWMVYRVMHDWLCITNIEAAGHWLEKAKEAEDEIGRVRNHRRGTLTRALHPF